MAVSAIAATNISRSSLLVAWTVAGDDFTEVMLQLESHNQKGISTERIREVVDAIFKLLHSA